MLYTTLSTHHWSVFLVVIFLFCSSKFFLKMQYLRETNPFWQVNVKLYYTENFKLRFILNSDCQMETIVIEW